VRNWGAGRAVKGGQGWAHAQREAPPTCATAAITPLPIHRLAAAHPERADTVFRKLLRKPGFTWSEHGEALLRRRKPWYYAKEPRPGVSVIGERLSALAAGY
jgi:hypothetical protein